MGTEIERKFLVNIHSGTRQNDIQKSTFMEQFYLAKDPWVRVRIAGDKAWITVKGPGNLVRAEFEWEIPVADAEGLRALGKGSITKTRHLVPYGDHLWEVDQFHGSLDGLWLAEIELKTADESFALPPWAGREVTEDHRYANAYLVEHGRPTGDPRP
jgi:CYTH domain-containing protein